MKPFYKSPLTRDRVPKKPSTSTKQQQQDAEIPIGELTLLEPDASGCDPYNNTGKLEIKNNSWPNKPK